MSTVTEGEKKHVELALDGEVVANVPAEVVEAWSDDQADEVHKLIHQVRTLGEGSERELLLERLGKEFGVAADEITPRTVEVIEEEGGQTALATDDPQPLTNEVKGARPTEGKLVVGKPKPITVDHDYQPGKRVLIVMHCAVGDVTVGTGKRSHEVTPVEALLWEDMAETPGEVIASIQELPSRPRFTKNIVDHAVSVIDRALEEGLGQFESNVDLVEHVQEKLYARFSIEAEVANDSEVDEEFGAEDEAVDEIEPDEIDAPFDEPTSEGEW